MADESRKPSVPHVVEEIKSRLRKISSSLDRIGLKTHAP
jgi:hypothetical protein